MRILWVSSKFFSDESDKKSGVWIKALAILLAKMPEITLASVSIDRQLSTAEYSEYENVKQWKLPLKKVSNGGCPDSNAKGEFIRITNEFNPDIIQVWGSENPLKLFPFDERIPGKKVLTMQGVLSSIAPSIFAGLSFWELISTVGIREIVYRKGIIFDKKSFEQEGKIEARMIKKCDYIITQSDWTESQITHINPKALYFRINRALRPEFISAKKWANYTHDKPILYSAAIGYSLKGLHVLLRALKIVKEVYPNVELRLAGSIGRLDFLGNGYLRMINRYIKKFGLEKNVVWLGAISAEQIISQLQKSSVFINPSFIESYSLTLAEAMYIGTPSVVSFAGAMPELADNNVEALFFSPGDYKRCADLIIKLLSHEAIAKQLSSNAIKRAEERNNGNEIVNRQIEIYRQIINS